MKVVIVFLFMLIFSGCASEVDKCVAAWEKANPGGGDYCAPYNRGLDGKCRRGYSMSRAQALALTRRQCLDASSGKN